MSVEPKSQNRFWHHDISIREMLGDKYEDFDRMFDLTDRVPGSYTRLNCAKLYEWAMQLNAQDVVVEIGVDQGRSASILLHCANQKGNRVLLIDSWESILFTNYWRVANLVSKFPMVRAGIVHGKSDEVVDEKCFDRIDMLHIDANHYYGGVDVDCELWLPKLKSGGIVLFHDYASSFEAVTASVDKYTDGWEDLGSYDSLAVRRKP